MRKFLGFLALSALSAVGCDDDGGDDSERTASRDLDASVSTDARTIPPGMMAVTLRFKAKIGSEDLVCGQLYQGLGSTKIAGKPQDFRVFVHNVRLIAEGGAEVPVTLDDRPPFQAKEVALLDFTDGRESCTSGAPASNMALYGIVPTGKYAGIAFTTGISDDLNHGDPALAPAPLKAPGAFWTWLQGYRFVMAELNVRAGLAALDAGTPDAGTSSASGGHGGAPALPGLVIAHFGSQICLGGIGSFKCEQPNRSEVRLLGFDPASHSVVADLGALFSPVDLTKTVQCHGGGGVCEPMLPKLGIDIASGQPLPTQEVFRVE